MWNVVVFYLYVLNLPKGAALAIFLGLALMTFVPSRYLYPSRPGMLNRVATVLGVVWGVCVAYLVLRLDRLDPARYAGGWSIERVLAWVSLGYPLFYLAASWWVTLRRWTRHARAPADGNGQPARAEASA
jgi:phosphatidylcholine synthase